jgi:hypothetical protein
MIHDSDHVLLGHAVAFHHQPDQWVLQQAGNSSSVV